MKYSIVTTNPTRLKDEIFQCVSNKKDSKNVSIDTWKKQTVTFTEKDGQKKNEDVLVHTTQAWSEIGCIRLVADEQTNRHLYAVFYYWESFPKEQRDGTHERYLYGRLTELLLIHFSASIRTLMITKE